MRFPPARLDLVARAMTTSYLLAAATVAGARGRRPATGDGRCRWRAFVVLAVLGVACLAFRPTAFVLDERGLEVRRAVRGRRIPGPLSAERVAQSALVGARLARLGRTVRLPRAVPASRTAVASSRALTARRSAVLVRGGGSACS